MLTTPLTSTSEIILGLLLGFLSATISESIGHKIFGHPGPFQLKIYFKYPNFFAPFLRAYFHHYVIHHKKTYKTDIVTQFESPIHKAEVDTWIAREFPTEFANLIWEEQYNLTLKGVSGILPFAIPFFTGPIVIAILFGKIAFFTSLITGLVPVLMSKYIHPFIHQPERMSEAPFVVQLIAKTKYMQWIFKNHYMHHKYLDTNFNLLLGGDYLVGAHRQATIEEKNNIQKLWLKFK